MRVIIQSTFITLLAIYLLIALPTLGQTGGDYELSRTTIDGGGGTSIGGPYTLTGTIGQPDAGWSSGGNYELLGGFWGPICTVDFHSFARFAEQWLETDCNDLNDWCGGADLEPDADVDFVDYSIFANYWLCFCPYNWQLK